MNNAFRRITAALGLALIAVSVLGVRGQDYTYMIADGTVTITGYTGPGGGVNIPALIEGLPITALGDGAFRNRISVTSLSIPESVISLGASTFEGCTNLPTVTIPNSVTTIGYQAFYSCTSLTSVTLGSSLTNIGSRAFALCTMLESINIPESVTAVGGYVFYSCSNLAAVAIPDGVVTLGNGAFFQCHALATAVVGNSVTSLGSGTFWQCANLTSVTIGKSVTKIADEAFYGCTALANLIIPARVVSLGPRAFMDCSGLIGLWMQGNAPTNWGLFGGADHVTVYYLPGTTGWGTTYAGRPTAFWVTPNPLILTSAANFGVQTNRFGFRISWAANPSVIVEASTDLTGSSWFPVSTNALADGWCDFSDPFWTNHPRRFYRLRSPYASLALSCASVDATTIQLNWPPIPTAVEYKVYRDRKYVGSTVGSCGYFTDTGLAPVTTYEYFLAAFDGNNHLLGSSSSNAFTTTSANRVRTHYNLLAIGFYPNGPDADLPHVKTFFRHKTDFIRLASVNSAILEPYKGDIVCLRAAPPVFPSTLSVDYARLAETPYPELDGYSIVDLVERGDVDVVNVVADTTGARFLENALVGNKGFNPQGSGERWSAIPARCSRSFFVNANSADARAYDAYCHCVEGIMSCLCDGNPGNWPRNYPCLVYTKTRTDFTTTYSANLHLFERFRLADQWNGVGAYASLGNGNCGSSHFPPTSRRDTDEHYDGDYAYYDLKTWQRYIDCAADDWLQFPALTGSKRKLNGYDYGAFNKYVEGELAYADSFGASPELHPSFWSGTASYHQWWFFHLPHNPGVTDGKLNNWWPYIYDFNRFNGSPITYSVIDDSQPPTSFATVDGEYGTELPDAQWWGYWCSWSDFGAYGRVSVVSNAIDPTFVSQGQFALQVLVDQEAFHYHGRNDVFYPITRNARWNLSDLREVSVSLKPGLNPFFIAGANPVIRLCANGGNRIEFAPLKNGRYANLFLEPSFLGTNGWFTFTAPIEGSSNWEVNVIGYIDPTLSPQQIADARQQLKQNILSEVNYVEISVHSDGERGSQVSYYLDGLEFRSGQ